MCGTCGCGEEGSVSIRKPGEAAQAAHAHVHDHEHSHGEYTHAHSHEHFHAHNEKHQAHHHSHHSEHPHQHHHSDHSHSHRGEIQVEIDVLQQNNLLAERNRGFFEAKNMKVINLVSSPGSGKTSLLEKTIKEHTRKKDFYVIEGDQQTMNDANRIESAGAPVVQINTGNGCHLDADMINKGVKKLQPAENAILFIENVGNLVCPSLFDLGETKRVVIVSITEGEDKPIKYPNMFQSSDICIINKMDLLPHLDFDLEKMKEYARRVKPGIEFIELSVKTGEGMQQWYEYLDKL